MTALGDVATAPLRDCLSNFNGYGRAEPGDCRLFGTACRPDAPVGACMVSSEGICRIWHENGLGVARAGASP